ncbi:MAG: hypothetical protein GW921_02705 [Gallionella sp.]|nr:hypothetical protein [Gallionella sp.]
MEKFSPAKQRIKVRAIELVRIVREPQKPSQSQLAALTGIAQATISAITTAC